MKKIFRMALVFALAGATLMYTGCTKDYGEDIDKINGDVTSLRNDLTGKLGELSNEVSSIRSSVTALESAYKAADKALEDKLQGGIDANKADIATLKGKVSDLEKAVADLEKFATKDELKEAKEALEKKITDDIAALKEEILGKVDALQKQLDEFKEELAKKAGLKDFEELKAEVAKLATKEEVEALKAKIKEVEDAQKEIDNVYGFLSDELRSIVFYPEFYFAGIEATSYDFGSFIGYELFDDNPFAAEVFYYDTDEEEIIESTPGVTPPTGENIIKYTIPAGSKWLADLYYETDAKGNPVYYKYDPETFDWVLKNGKKVLGKAGDDDVRMFFPGNFLQGQTGLAYYNLNPSSFPTDSAEWSLNGRNLKYVLKSEEEETWNPVFKGITKDASGLAAVAYEIENPEKIYSSILGSVIDAAIGLYIKYSQNEDGIEDLIETFIPALQRPRPQANTNYNWMEQAQAELVAKGYRWNNVPTMQLAAELSDGRQVVSDWHAISSSEEFVDHLAFAGNNPYETLWGDCGLFYGEFYKDLYPYSQWAIVDPYSVPVKYNGGPVDLNELIAIHTSDAMSYSPIAEYSIDEFNAKYPGYHFEFELLPYTIGGFSTSEDMYGKIEGSLFTPCLVVSEGGKAYSTPIAKDSEDGISSVGRMPVVLVTLVNDETKDVQAYGWFKIRISKDEILPKFFDLPDLGVVPYICANYALSTKWHEFNYFVLENLKVEYGVFVKAYTFDGIWSYQNVYDERTNSVKKELVETNTKATEGVPASLVFKNYDSNSKTYKNTKTWGTAQYSKDNSGEGINDAFTWNVNSQNIGEGKNQTIYFKFTNGEQEVYFAMKADVAKKAKMKFASNKIENMWFGDINSEAYNTVRVSVPVPTVTPTPSVYDFKKNLYEFFLDGKPALSLEDDSADIYKSIYNNNRSPYRSELTTTTTKFQFAESQPVIDTKDVLGHDTPLFVKDWKYEGSGDKDYMHLYAQMYQRNVFGGYDPVQDEYSDGKGGYVKVPKIYANGSNLVATITGNTTDGYTIVYANTEIAKILLNLWSYKKTDQAEMLFANITAKNKYGSTNCVEVADGDFHVRFIRPIDVDFAAQDIAEESQVDGANVEIIRFFDGITDWNNQKVIVKVMVDKVDEDGKVIKDAEGNPIQEWNGEYAENVIKTINMYDYYAFEEITIDLPNAMRNHAEIGNPEKFVKISRTNTLLAIGTVDDDGVFTADTDLEDDGSKVVDISDFNNLKPLVVNYRNKQNYADPHTIMIPVYITYSWGTLTDYMVINVKDTGSTEGR